MLIYFIPYENNLHLFIFYLQSTVSTPPPIIIKTTILFNYTDTYLDSRFDQLELSSASHLFVLMLISIDAMWHATIFMLAYSFHHFSFSRSLSLNDLIYCCYLIYEQSAHFNRELFSFSFCFAAHLLLTVGPIFSNA